MINDIQNRLGRVYISKELIHTASHKGLKALFESFYPIEIHDVSVQYMYVGFSPYFDIVNGHYDDPCDLPQYDMKFKARYNGDDKEPNVECTGAIKY